MLMRDTGVVGGMFYVSIARFRADEK